MEDETRVLLINPPITVSGSDYVEGIGLSAPLGLAYLAAVLSDAGHEVEILDCLGLWPMPLEPQGDHVRCGMPEGVILRKLADFQPDLVGITCAYTANAGDATALARLVKRDYSESVPLVMGGAHVSVCPEEVLGTGVVDFAAIGEGEGTALDLVRALETGAPTDRIGGLLSTGTGGRVTGVAERDRISDLDTIPMPRRDLLPMDAYISHQQILKGSINSMRHPTTTMITSRGCPENCVFCAIRCTWGRKWVGRSPDRIVEEIEFLKDRYGIREIDFLDDSISVSKKRLRELCELMIERRVDVKWTTPNGIAIWSLDDDILRLMKRAGCYRLTFGMESGDPETLKFIRKRYTFDRALHIISFANHIGLWTIGTFILGFPYETREQMENTIRFAIESKLDLAIFYCAAPFPGTDLYEICVDEGIEVADSTSLMMGGVSSLEMSAEEIARVREEANARFVRSVMRRPWKALGKIRSLEDLGYVARVARYSLGLARARPEGRSTTSYLYSKKKGGGS